MRPLIERSRTYLLNSGSSAPYHTSKPSSECTMSAFLLIERSQTSLQSFTSTVSQGQCGRLSASSVARAVFLVSEMFLSASGTISPVLDATKHFDMTADDGQDQWLADGTRSWRRDLVCVSTRGTAHGQDGLLLRGALLRSSRRTWLKRTRSCKSRAVG